MRGFTVIELLITIAIAGILSAILFASDFSLRDQYSLFHEQDHLYNVFLEAKNLALAGYARNPENVCGYGISFQAPRTVIIYKNYKESGTNPDGTNIGDCLSVINHKFFYSYGNTGSGGTPWPDDQIIDEQNNPTANFSFQLDPNVVFDFGNGNKINRIDILFVSPKPTVFITENGDNTTANSSFSYDIKLKTIKSQSVGGIEINNFGQITWL